MQPDGGSSGAPLNKPRLSLKGLKRPDATPTASLGAPTASGGLPPASGGSFTSSAAAAATPAPRLSLKSRLSLKGAVATPGPPSAGPAAPHAAATPAASGGGHTGGGLRLKTFGTPSSALRPSPSIGAGTTAPPPPAASTPGPAAAPPSSAKTPLSSAFERQQHLNSAAAATPAPHTAAPTPTQPVPHYTPAASPFVAASQTPLSSAPSVPTQSAVSGDTAAKKPRLTLKVKTPAVGGGSSGGGYGGGGGASSYGAAGSYGGYGAGGSGGGAYGAAAARPAAAPSGGVPARPIGGAGGLAGSGSLKAKMLVKIKPLQRPAGAGGSGALHHARSAAPSAAPHLTVAPPRVRPLARPGAPPALAAPRGAELGSKRSSSGLIEIQPARAAKRPRIGGGAGGSDGEPGDDDDDYVPPKRAPPPAFLQRHGSAAPAPAMPAKKKMIVKGGRVMHGGARPAAPVAAPAAPVVARIKGSRECPPTGENLFKVWDAVAKKDQFQFFAFPVDEDKYPTYREVISTPMDLSTIKTRLDSGYYISYEAMLADFDLMFDNAINFNPKEHIIHELAVMMKDIAHTAVVMVRQGKTLRGALAAKTRMLNSRLASHRAIIQAEQKAADRAARKAAGEPVSDSEPDSPVIDRERERQERDRQERERQNRQLDRAERGPGGGMHRMGRGRGRGRRGRGRGGRGGGTGAIYEEDAATRRARVAQHAPKESDIRSDENAMLSFGAKAKQGAAGGVLGLMAPWGGLANGANAEGMAFGWGRPVASAVLGPGGQMPPGVYAASISRFAAAAGRRVEALVQAIMGQRLKRLEPAVAVAEVARQEAAKRAQQQQQQQQQQAAARGGG